MQLSGTPSHSAIKINLSSIARWVVVLLLSIGATMAAPLLPVRVSENVYAFIADNGDISLANRGRIGNTGFIIGPEGIVVIDTGVSFRHAQAMVDAIRRVSKLPISLAIITHAHQEFLFGAAYFQAQHIPVLTHVKTAQLMRSRCENCLHHLKETLGVAEMRGSKVIAPDQLVDGSEFISAAGMSLELHYFGWGNTPGDLTVFERNTGVLFAGGLVDVGRIPELRDSRVHEWHLILGQLNALPIKHIVPGHGSIGNRRAIEQMQNYLNAIERKVRALYDDGVSLSDVESKGDLPEFSHWALYREQHHRNVHRVYLQLEQSDLEN